MNTTTYDSDEFWDAFIPEFTAAQARVLVQSPFLGARRIKILSKHIELLTRRGVVVCAFVQQPPNWEIDSKLLDTNDSYEVSQVRLLIGMLQSLGVHVNVREKIHAKLAVIDDVILWEGSLNIFSHANTKEHMRRSTATSEIKAISKKHRLLDCSICASNALKLGSVTSQAWSLSRFGELVRRYRVSLGLSQRELAKRCGITNGRISQIESGKDNFTASTFMQLATHLDMEPVLIPKFLVPSVANLLHQATKRMLPES